MRNFEGFTRIAIVIIPTEEEYERMLEKWNDNTLRDTSISLLELKGAYEVQLPECGAFDESTLRVFLNEFLNFQAISSYQRKANCSRPSRSSALIKKKRRKL